MGLMNRGLNLPGIQRIMNEFEKESATMDMKEEMMADAVDDVMDEEDEEEEGDMILKQVLEEIGVGLSQQVILFTLPLLLLTPVGPGGTNWPVGDDIHSRSTAYRARRVVRTISTTWRRRRQGIRRRY